MSNRTCAVVDCRKYAFASLDRRELVIVAVVHRWPVRAAHHQAVMAVADMLEPVTRRLPSTSHTRNRPVCCANSTTRRCPHNG
ncbi:hypothetical protein E1258_12865 [Micromonospora sp. KC207]|uniref:hypothetical protein n=1 Tax=Micromonospora sp. KC207 TaxID=2530377 RepID=UPI00104EABA5|nr:hypothetical protein [Micromonospora sp. KC207]TDC61028.1 hypothetical protein E1258_12865 [Micromonospora sp. KC207]